MDDIKLLLDILSSDKPSKYIKENEEYIFSIIPELKKCKGFKQNNEWHIYDVYEHIMHVVDGVDNNLILRLSALFHDIGKPYVYSEDENGIGHFYKHYIVSRDIWNVFADKYNIDNKDIISNLIYYHDINISKLSDDDVTNLINVFGDNIWMLFNIKRSDLMAQNSKYHYLLSDYDKEEKRLLLMRNK